MTGDCGFKFLVLVRLTVKPDVYWPMASPLLVLKIDPMGIVGMRVLCVCVCPRPRLLISSGVMWCDMDLMRLVK